MILLIDNYDSFTYNLYQYLGEIITDIKVYRNDQITVEEIEKLNPTNIIISPGPGHPKDAGIIVELIKKLGSKIPILGICLGHQAIGIAYGAKVRIMDKIYHGKSLPVKIDAAYQIFKGLPEKFLVGRYHSLEIYDILPCLKIIAADEKGTVMAVKHENYDVYGLQFHPESILTEYGKEILNNFLEIRR